MRKTLGIVLVLGVGGVFAQPRNWGFDRDTVIERLSRTHPASDVATLSNTGGDTLRLTSLIVQAMLPATADSVAVYLAPPSAKVTVGNPYALNLRVPPGQSLGFRNFQLDWPEAQFILKSAARPVHGDTLLLRLRFVAQGGVEDTLLLLGYVRGYYASALHPRSGVLKIRTSGSRGVRDARGRAQKALGSPKTPIRAVFGHEGRPPAKTTP